MKVTYELVVTARCPVDPQITDVYDTTIVTDGFFLPVEEIKEAVSICTQEPVYQETLTQCLADRLSLDSRRVSVKTVGTHSGVRTVASA